MKAYPYEKSIYKKKKKKAVREGKITREIQSSQKTQLVSPYLQIIIPHVNSLNYLIKYIE